MRGDIPENYHELFFLSLGPQIGGLFSLRLKYRTNEMGFRYITSPIPVESTVLATTSQHIDLVRASIAGRNMHIHPT